MVASPQPRTRPRNTQSAPRGLRERALRWQRAGEMAARRAKIARLPRELRSLDPGAWLLGRPPAHPPGARLAPSPPQLPVLGHFHVFGRGPDRLDRVLDLPRRYGDVVRLRFGGIHAHLVANPDLVQEVLHARNREFDKHTRGTYKLRLVLGLGLLTSEGSFWLRQRRISQPAFHRRKIASFAERMVTAAEEMCDEWREGEAFDVHDAMMRVTLRVVSETLLGTDVTGQAASVGRALDVVIADVNRRVNQLFDVMPPIPTRQNRRFMEAMGTLDDVVLAMIRERRRSGVQRDDLLQMLMDTRDADTGEGMNDAQLRDEVMTIFLAGHETTANALSWSLYLMSRSPEVARRLRAEVQRVLGDRPATFEDLAALQYTRQVVEETLRLYPPAWMIARAPVEDTELGGYFLPKRSLLLLSPWVVHRHPAYWPDPEGFDPDRFAPEARAGHHRFQYFPFGGGPRLCIGNNFALMEAQLILATLAQRWHLELVSGRPVVAEPLVTLRPRGGLWMIPRRP